MSTTSKQELRKQISEVTGGWLVHALNDFDIFPTNGDVAWRTRKINDEILDLFLAYSKQREVEAVSEALETVLQDVEHTTECNCCANGGGEHDLAAHIRVIERYKAAPQPLSPEQKEKL